MAKILRRVPDFQLMLTDPQFQAIGHVTMQWAFLEYEIDREIVCLLSRYENRNERVEFQDKFGVRTRRWIELASRSYRKHPEHIKAVQNIVGRANNIKPERDKFVHGTISRSGTFFRIRKGSIVQVSDTLGKAPYIEDLACRISEISASLFGHHRALRVHYRKSP